METDYDSVGRPSRVTLPYTAAAGQTNSNAPAVTTSYDGLNRPTVTTDSGGGTTSYSYSQNDVLVTIGPAPSGENTKRRQMEYDGLGRLTSVCELTSAAGSGSCGQSTSQTGYWTKYTYDGLGNLTNAIQNAQGSPQSRSYSYDGLSRLTSETSPESNTTTYTYDSIGATSCGGPYSFPGDLVKRADANGNNTCYYYDALHRLTDAGNSGPNATACKRLRYDNSAGVLGSRPSGVTVNNGIGRLVEAVTDTCAWPVTQASIITDEWFSYTPRGEAAAVYEATPHSNGYYQMNASYWANGARSQLSGNIGIPTINYLLDGEGRTTTVNANTGTYPANTAAYNVAGAATSVTLGSSDSVTLSYDAQTGRMTQYNFNIYTQSITGALGWNANGTLSSLNIGDPYNSANTQNCTYGYEDLARLSNVNCGSQWSQTFAFDAYGNISKSGSISYQASYANATNRIVNVGGVTPSYDANGNLTNDGNAAYSWDADGNAVGVGAVGVTYDALGRMVEQNRSGSYIQVVYGPGGEKLALMNGQTLQKGFVGLPAGAVAVYTSSGLSYWRLPDMLGSSRAASTPSRTVYSDTAYAPYGEPYAESGTTDRSFTGQNQDTIPGLYDFLFREYSPVAGRWISPDPAGLAAVDPSNPQSLNRYAYVINDPINWIDPLGLAGCDKDERPCHEPHFNDAVSPFPGYGFGLDEFDLAAMGLLPTGGPGASYCPSAFMSCISFTGGVLGIGTTHSTFIYNEDWTSEVRSFDISSIYSLLGWQNPPTLKTRPPFVPGLKDRNDLGAVASTKPLASRCQGVPENISATLTYPTGVRFTGKPTLTPAGGVTLQGAVQFQGFTWTQLIHASAEGSVLWKFPFSNDRPLQIRTPVVCENLGG